MVPDVISTLHPGALLLTTGKGYPTGQPGFTGQAAFEAKLADAQTGEFYELYAIAAAVLGGCSLRGGEGTVLGVVIAAAVLRLIYNSINMVGISTHLEFGILGLVILLGVIGDEYLKKVVARKQAALKT